jgi:pentatricopeptide repeat protein
MCWLTGRMSWPSIARNCGQKWLFDNNSYVMCALMDMYAKCGCIENTLKLFDLMPEKTLVVWKLSYIFSFIIQKRKKKNKTL